MIYPYIILLSIILLLLDWKQTLTIVKNPDKWHETNPILGKHPSEKRVNIYFIICFVLYALFLNYSGEDLGLAGAVCVSIVELYAVINNYKLGIK